RHRGSGVRRLAGGGVRSRDPRPGRIPRPPVAALVVRGGPARRRAGEAPLVVAHRAGARPGGARRRGPGLARGERAGTAAVRPPADPRQLVGGPGAGYRLGRVRPVRGEGGDGGRAAARDGPTPAPLLAVRAGLGLLGLLGAAAALPARAQAPALTVVLQNQLPRIQATGLLADGKFVGLMRSGFPLRLHYRLELWRSRSGWFDQFVTEASWDAVARHDPLADDFVLIRTGGSVARYGSPEALARDPLPREPAAQGDGQVLLRLPSRRDDAQRERSRGTHPLAEGGRGARRVGRRQPGERAGPGRAAPAGADRRPAAAHPRGAFGDLRTRGAALAPEPFVNGPPDRVQGAPLGREARGERRFAHADVALGSVVRLEAREQRPVPEVLGAFAVTVDPVEHRGRAAGRGIRLRRARGVEHQAGRQHP